MRLGCGIGVAGVITGAYTISQCFYDYDDHASGVQLAPVTCGEAEIVTTAQHRSGFPYSEATVTL